MYYGYNFKIRGVGGIGAILHDIMLANIHADYTNLELVFIEEGYDIPLFNGSINDTDEPDRTWHSLFNSFSIKKESECKEIWPKCPPNFTDLKYTIGDYAGILQKRICQFKPEIESQIEELVKQSPFNSNTDIVLHIRQTDKITEMNKIIGINVYINECEKILSLYNNELSRIYICTDDQSCCLTIKEHFARKNIDVVWDTRESIEPLHVLKLKGKLAKSVAQQELLNAFKNIFIMRDAKYLIGARSSYFFRIGELLRFPKKISNLQDSEKFGVAPYSLEPYMIRPFYNKAFDTFTNSFLDTKETIEKYNRQLKEEKIINIPGAISKEFLTSVKPLLEEYKYWTYFIKNTSSDSPRDFYNLNDPEISEQFKKCKSDYESLNFSYRFKKAIQTAHYHTCRCIVCKITDTIKSFPFIDTLSKLVGFNLTPGEIFMSNYGENDFLNMHHDKAKGDIAVTISFTYNWNPTYGGILHFTDSNNRIYKSAMPGEGDINIFLLEPGKGLNHFVSTVTANKHRYMISAWYSRIHELVHTPSQPIHFCSFGSSSSEIKKQEYTAALNRICRQAEDSQFFTTIDVYNQNNTANIELYSKFINENKRGYGYWIWKPLVILDMMNKYEKNSVIIYADAAFEIIRNNSTIELFNKYINDVNTHDSHRLGFLDKTLECEYTKQDLFEYLEINDDKYKSSKQLLGGIQILLNTDENKKLIEEWLKIMITDKYHYLDDSPSKSTNHATFIEHRHDQSILSLLKKKYDFCKEECFGTLIPEYGKTPIRYLPIHPSWKRNS